MSSRWWAALLSRAPAPRFRAALATTIPLQHQPIHRRRLLPRYQGEFHRSAHDNQRQFTNSRYLGYDKGGGGGKKKKKKADSDDEDEEDDEEEEEEEDEDEEE